MFSTVGDEAAAVSSFRPVCPLPNVRAHVVVLRLSFGRLAPGPPGGSGEGMASLGISERGSGDGIVRNAVAVVGVALNGADVNGAGERGESMGEGEGRTAAMTNALLWGDGRASRSG